MPSLSIDEVYALESPAPSRSLSIDEAFASEPETNDRKFADYFRTFSKGDITEEPSYMLEQTVGRLPFVGPAITGANTFADISNIKAAVNDPNADEDTIRSAAGAAAYYAKKAKQDPSLGESIIGGLLDLPGFAAEFALTGGAYTAGRKAAETGAKKLLGKYAETTAAKIATGLASRAAGVAAQTLANPQRIAQSTADDQLQRVLQDPKQDSSLVDSLPAGFLDAFIELGSERAGATIAKGAGKLLEKVGGDRLVGLKNAVMRKWLRLNPESTVNDFVSKVQSKIGWNGVLGEIGEERVGEAARNLTGLEDGGILPGGWKQLAAEAVVMSAPGAMGLAARLFTEKPRPQIEAFIQQPTPEAAKELGVDLVEPEDLSALSAALNDYVTQQTVAPNVPQPGAAQGASQPELEQLASSYGLSGVEGRPAEQLQQWVGVAEQATQPLLQGTQTQTDTYPGPAPSVAADTQPQAVEPNFEGMDRTQVAEVAKGWGIERIKGKSKRVLEQLIRERVIQSRKVAPTTQAEAVATPEALPEQITTEVAAAPQLPAKRPGKLLEPPTAEQLPQWIAANPEIAQALAAKSGTPVSRSDFERAGLSSGKVNQKKRNQFVEQIKEQLNEVRPSDGASVPQEQVETKEVQAPEVTPQGSLLNENPAPAYQAVEAPVQEPAPPQTQPTKPAAEQLPPLLAGATDAELHGFLKSMGVNLRGRNIDRARLVGEVQRIFKGTDKHKPRSFSVDPNAPKGVGRINVDTKAVQELLPGAEVQQNGPSSWRVAHKNGWYVDIAAVPNIKPNAGAIEKLREIYGDQYTEADYATLEGEGYYEAVTKDGQRVPIGSLIALSEATGADKSVLKHEVLHLAKAMGFFKGEEWDTLAKKYAPGISNEKQVEEAVASALQKKGVVNNGIFKRIQEFVRKFLKSIGFGKENADDIVRKMQSAEFWDREPGGQVGEDGSFSLAPDKKWFPKSQKVIEAAKQDKATPQQWLGMLQKNGVKEEELEWMGLTELLGPKSSHRTVTKQQVLDALKGGVRIEEVVKGGPSGNWVVYNGENNDYFETKAEAVAYAKEIGAPSEDLFFEESTSKEAPKYANWQLPGGENYRELLLTLPTPSTLYFRDAAIQALKRNDNLGFDTPGEAFDAIRLHSDWRDRWEVTDEADAKILDDVATAGEQARNTYRTSHFDEPNVLAHLRFNERTDADGNKVLFIEEVQSDWHQEGRKQGYKDQPEPADVTEAKTEGTKLHHELADHLSNHEMGMRGSSPSDKLYNIRNTSDEGMLQSYSDIYGIPVEKLKTYRQYHITLNRHENQKRKHVPNAPFKKSWPILAMKRAIQWASENGFDKIAWTTGEQQAERYDLSKQVREINYLSPEQTTHGQGQLEVVGLEGENVLRESIPPEKLEDYIGKEAAKRLLEAKPDSYGYQTIKGDGLKVGGEGMKSFYDSILPNEVNKFIKKFGAKVGRVAVEGPTIDDFSPGFDITPEMRASALGEGQPMFALTSKDPKVRRKLANIGKTKGVRDWLTELDRIATEAGEPGVRADQEVFDKAAELLASDRQGERASVLRAAAKGGQLNDVETVVAKQLFQDEAYEALESGDEAKIAEAAKLRDAYRATGTEQGRAFRQRRDPLGGKSVIEAQPAERQAAILDEIYKRPPKEEKEFQKASKNGDTETLEKLNKQLARRLQKVDRYLHSIGLSLADLPKIAEDPLETARVRKQVAASKTGAADKLYEYWQNLGLLSGPATQAVNIAGNAASGLYDFGIQRQIEALTNLGGWDKSGAQPGEIPYIWKGMRRGITEGMRNALITWKTETPVTQRDKWDQANVAIGGKAGRIVRAFGWRPLQVADEFFNSLFSNLHVGAAAYRNGKVRNLEGEALTEFIDAEIANRESLSWRMARNHAAELTMQQETEGLAKQVKEVGLKIKKDVLLARWVIPFVTFPVNSAATALRKAPVTGDIAAMKKAYNNWMQGKPATLGMNRYAAERVIAWGATMALLSTIDPDDPWITGSKTNPQGTPKNSIKVGDKWYEYGRIEPFATALSLMIDGVNTAKGGSSEQIAGAVVDLPVSQIADKTFLRGLSDFMTVWGRGGDPAAKEDAIVRWSRWSARFGESFVPNAYRQTVEAARPNLDEFRVWGTDTKEKLKRTAERLGEGVEAPGAEQELRYDPWGRPLEKSRAPFWSAPATDFVYRLLTPVRNTDDNVTLGDKLIARWNALHPDEAKALDRPMPYFTLQGKKHGMTGDEYEEFQREAGQAADRIVNRILKDKETPTAADMKRLDKAITDGRATARAKLLPKWRKRIVDPTSG